VTTSSGPPVVRGAVEGGELASLVAAAVEVEAWPVGSHVWGHYAERTEHGDFLCRTENVSACHPRFAGLVHGVLRDVATSAAGDAVADFKDKLNYKHPGGAGFGPHQDLLAYPEVARVVSVLVAIDECTTASGCLWLAEGVDRLLDSDGRGVVRADVAATLRWEPAELAPGDAVVIDGLAPHSSEANRSPASRRVFVASYAPVSEGYGRDRYYGLRSQAMVAGAERDGRARISTLADFEGTPVADSAAPERCTH
jgi:Phytanoyl-CoA dioxygenase (PhyH)